MEYFGVIAFIMLCCFSEIPKKIKHLEAKMKKMERKQKGESQMSKLINELAGRECKIKSDSELALVGSSELLCFVLDIDDEWIKIQFTDKKKNQVTKLLRIENIEEIEVI